VIRKIVIRRFKRFDEVEFVLPDNIVLAGPNNTGKTTVLQAIAAWSLAFNKWKELNDFQRHGGAYPKAPIARQAFSAVPLRSFDLLWSDRKYTGSMEIGVQTGDWAITMEFLADSTEQIYVRPKPDVEPAKARAATLSTVFVPAMTGLPVDEPLYQRAKIDQLLGQARPGEVLRNLLVEANASEEAWWALHDSIGRLFGCELVSPDSTGAHIVAEYFVDPARVGISVPRDLAWAAKRLRGSKGVRYDIASAGSGFQQVLMLLTFLHTRPGAVLLLDEPDAHLHVILQDAIYGELRAVAAEKRSQLVIATHSEVIINSVEPKELCLMLHRPRLLADTDERALLIKSLGALSNEDILLALEAPGVLYLEDYTDLEILRAWAKIFAHPAYELLTTWLFWKKTVSQPRAGAAGMAARDHYRALTLVRDDLPGLELLDGDARPDLQSSEITGQGLQRLRWRRYEIESYLVHPAALERFVEQQIGPGEHSKQAKVDLRAYLEKTFTRAFLEGPMEGHPLIEAYLEQRKARTEVLPPILDAAGLPAFPYTRYHEIAAVMHPGEIHSEVIEKLDAIVRAFRQ
jgi:predicted ATPase